MGMKDFAKATGQAASKRLGKLTGTLLGKTANGLEALEAVNFLAEAKPNSFMDKAREAIHIAVKKLDAIGTIAYANKDEGFNASMAKAFNVHRNAVAAKASAAPPERTKKSTGPKLSPA